MTPPARLRVMASGFWLPFSQSSFFEAKDKPLVTGINSHLLEKPANNKLQTTVFRRLMTVLYHKHYTHVYPIIPSNHVHANPEAVIFAASVPAAASDDREPIVWITPSPPIHSLICMVNAHGFYLWLAIYEASENENRDSEQVALGLKTHIDDIVRKDYFSHYSWLKDYA